MPDGIAETMCSGCSLCCRLFPVGLSETEFRSGKFITEFEDTGGLESFSEIEEFGLNILKKNDDESCIYLIDRKCSIYPERPQMCRDFFCGSNKPAFKEMIEDILRAR
jgi:Fe-S-cluster containining protein